MCLLAMSVKGRVRERLALVLGEELGVAQTYVIDLVARAFAVEALPLLGAAAALAASRRMQQQRHERGQARAQAVACQQCILELVLAHHILYINEKLKLDVYLSFFLSLFIFLCYDKMKQNQKKKFFYCFSH